MKMKAAAKGGLFCYTDAAGHVVVTFTASTFTT